MMLINVSKVAFNHYRDHITAKKTASEGQKLWYFRYRALWSTGQCKGHSPLGYAIDYKFGFDFGF